MHSDIFLIKCHNVRVSKVLNSARSITCMQFVVFAKVLVGKVAHKVPNKCDGWNKRAAWKIQRLVNKVINLGSDTFRNPFFQKFLQN